MTTLVLETMTFDEKLRAIELLWDDCFKNEASVASPAWHEEHLDAAECALREGSDHFVDWPSAKEQIRNY